MALQSTHSKEVYTLLYKVTLRALLDPERLKTSNYMRVLRSTLLKNFQGADRLVAVLFINVV